MRCATPRTSGRSCKPPLPGAFFVRCRLAAQQAPLRPLLDWKQAAQDIGEFLGVDGFYDVGVAEFAECFADRAPIVGRGGDDDLCPTRTERAIQFLFAADVP